MPKNSVSFEDLTAAALTGVGRALEARQIGPRNPTWPPYILVGFINIPDGIDWPWKLSSEPNDESPIPLTAHDHTIIMEAAIRQALPLLKSLGVTKERNRDFSTEDILVALGRIAPSEEVRDSINRALHWQRSFAGAEQRIDRGTQAKIKKLMGQVSAADSIDAKIRVLKSAQGTASEEEGGFAVGIKTAITMLEDGRATIYNPGFYGGLLGGGKEGDAIAKDAAEEIGDADVEGAVSGGAAGWLGGLIFPPAAPVTATALGAAGAVIGGIGGSLGKAASKLVDWIFD